jgi:flagellar biosynthesis/type III secretory pathway protein FliH
MMSTLSNGAAAARQAAEVEAFVYQNTESVLGVETPKSANEPPQEKSASRDSAPRTNEDDTARLVAEARADGIREGERLARAGFQEEVARERSRAAEVISGLQKERTEYYSKVEVQLVHFALAIAAKILHREAQVDRMVVAGLVKVMLEKLQQGTKVTVRVRPEAAESWRHYFHENSTMHVVEDFSLQPTDCVFVTELGTADVGLDAQLKEIEKGFFDLLAQKPVAKPE